MVFGELAHEADVVRRADPRELEELARNRRRRSGPGQKSRSGNESSSITNAIGRRLARADADAPRARQMRAIASTVVGSS